jgi:simple sugar transport system substrate-binding protein
MMLHSYVPLSDTQKENQMKLYKFAVLFLALMLVLSACAPAAPTAQSPSASGGSQTESGKWCSGVTIRFFAGGDEGDTFASIVLRGAKAAEADLGPKVDYVFSGWNTEKMTNQLREAIAAKPDGIAFMGHAGDDAVMPLAEQASTAGIMMMYQNVDVPLVRAKYGGGYVGAQLTPQGYASARSHPAVCFNQAITRWCCAWVIRDASCAEAGESLEDAAWWLPADGVARMVERPNRAPVKSLLRVLNDPTSRSGFPGGQLGRRPTYGR